MSAFDQAFAVVVGNEGGFTANPADPGNWTGGKVNKGRLIGTNWGISAAAFPTLDIAHLTQTQAASIYQVLYWQKAGCDALPYPLALLVFDAAVNNGVGAAVRFLQQTVNTGADGVAGPATAAAVRLALGNGSPDRVLLLCSEFQARRLMLMASLPTWSTFGLGWARRLCRMACLAGTINATAAKAA